MLMTACATSENVPPTSALCSGLQEPVDTFAQAILDNAEKTPAPVIITGTRVIRGYDAGCNLNS